MIPKRDEIKQLLEDENYAKQFILTNNLVFPVTICPEDGYSVNQIRDFKYKCRKKNHRKIYSSLSNTVFANLKINFSEFFTLAYYWLCGVTVKSAIWMSGHSSKTVVSIYNKLKLCIGNSIEENDTRIGGEGILVQLDESKFGKRKYHRGHHVEGAWIFGGIEITEERKCFAVVVEKRDSKTLNDLILKHVLPGSIVVTDGWKGYYKFKENVNYTHHWINHSISFKNEEGYHTNHIEGTWSGMKRIIPVQNRVKNKITGKILEFIWRRKNVNNLWNGLIDALKP